MVADAFERQTTRMSPSNSLCPTCQQGDLITITMTVSDRDLTFTTCHLCEAKWWERDGDLVPLASIIDLVVKK
jgi:formate dehydrogenase maturation protein FdhE